MDEAQLKASWMQTAKLIRVKELTWISEGGYIQYRTSTIPQSSSILQKYGDMYLPMAIAAFLFSLYSFLKTIGEKKKIKLKD